MWKVFLQMKIKLPFDFSEKFIKNTYRGGNVLVIFVLQVLETRFTVYRHALLRFDPTLGHQLPLQCHVAEKEKQNSPQNQESHLNWYEKLMTKLTVDVCGEGREHIVQCWDSPYHIGRSSWFPKQRWWFHCRWNERNGSLRPVVF